MKKKIIIGAILLSALAAALYLLFPIKENYVLQKPVTSSEDCVRRHFLNKDLWQKWIGGEKVNDTTFKNNNTTYTITKVLYNALQISIKKEKDSIQGMLSYDGNIEQKTCTISFTSLLPKQNNFFEKFKISQTNKHLEKDVSHLMESLQSYFNSQTKIYGFEIKRERTTDFYLSVSQKLVSQKPTLQEIYGMISNIEKFIASKKGTIKNSPMLNIFKEDSSYHVMVAIPTTSEIGETNDIKYKKLVEGNILVAEIKGGLFTIEKAEKELKNYVEDTKRMAPAIPYQSLITNRLMEQDTSKWITKLYYPVFY